jgi:acetylornithine deacetylase/succinyl-diaminopimelate desuccinylase-like protein
MIGATLQNTANPTMLEAGYKANVIPGSASAVIDGRFLPGYEDELNKTIKEIIGPDISVETISRDIALEIDFEGDLVEAMCNAITTFDPEGIPVPYLMSGGTDNKALSELGIVGYGFSPLQLPADLDFMALFHGVDERVPISGLEFGVKVLENFFENSTQLSPSSSSNDCRGNPWTIAHPSKCNFKRGKPKTLSGSCHRFNNSRRAFI